MWRLSCLGNTTLSLTGCLVVGDVPLNRERIVALAALVPKSLVQGVAKTSKKRGSMKGSTVCEPVLPSIQRKAPTSLAPQHWSMLGAVRGESDGTKKFVVSTIQEQNLYSLTKVALPQRAMNSYLELVLEQAAKRRQNRLKQSLVLSPEHGTDGPSSNGAFPLVPSRASSPEMGRFMNFDSSLFRWLLEEDLAVSDLNAEISDNRRRLLEVSVLCADEHRSPGALVQNLVEKNPVAFSEDIAAQCEVAYRSASEKAWKELDRVAKQPYHKENQRMFFTSLDDLRIERPFFVAPTLSKKASHLPSCFSVRIWLL